MLVQDPSSGGHDVDWIFDQARQMAAMRGPFEHQPSSSSRNFTGAGRLLSGETVAAAPQQPENVVHNIRFWTNGFTVNDGPLRRFGDPENAPFLEVSYHCVFVIRLKDAILLLPLIGLQVSAQCVLINFGCVCLYFRVR